MILPDSFWLYLKSKLPPMPHPFNTDKHGAQKLYYSPWEYEYVEKSKGFKNFENYTGDLKKFMEGKRIAELACGGGGKTVFFVKNGSKKAHGVDLSEIFIEQANKFAEEKGVKEKCFFSVGDAKNTNYKDSDFDVVMLASVLEHVEDPEALLREALRICKKGGAILFNTEGYYHWLGHHLWDALPIPWLHLFTSEKQRIRLYKKAVKNYPDAQERIDLRIGINSKGKENFDYLNHITLRKLDKILRTLELENLFNKKMLTIRTFRKRPFNLFGRMPLLREIFHESLDGMIVK
ncbi:MAG: class I SAM-dependent methyltransferase [Patescibacteria group bacterium]